MDEEKNNVTESESIQNVEQNSTNTNNNTKKKNPILTILVSLVTFAICFAIGYYGFPKENSSMDTKSLVNMPELNTSEITEAKINEDALIPEATEEHTVEDLEFKLPKTYTKDTSSDSEKYQTLVKDDTQYIFSATAIESDKNIEDIVEGLDTYDWSIEGAEIVSEEKMKPEVINDTTWYVKTIEHKLEDNKEACYFQYYYSQSGTNLYCVTYGIDFINGKEIDETKAKQFENIKQSMILK